MTALQEPTHPAATPFAVPVVDISAYASGGASDARATAAAQLEQACRTVGFVQVMGHGIAGEILTDLAAAIDAFFGQAPSVKERYRTPPATNRGYTPPHGESLSLTIGVEPDGSLNDYFEAFNIGVTADSDPMLPVGSDFFADNLWPADGIGFAATSFRRAVDAYFAEAGRVARTLCRIFADALDVDPRLFAAATSHSADVLRLLNYALPPDTVVDPVGCSGMGAHTDYGIVTVLWADDVPGLQILGSDLVWHDVRAAPGALLVNLGDITARWTNDRWLSTLHRVRPPVVDGRIQRRRSAAYFHDGNIDAVISTLPSCLDSNGPGYPPITIGEHLRNKLASSRAGELNGTLGPESDRARRGKEAGT